MLTMNLACRLALRLASAVLLMAPHCGLSAGEVRLEQGEFRIRDAKLLIRGVDYAPTPIGAAPGTPPPPCLYARDFPLIASMGANAVRTYGLLPEGDTSLLPLLETTGLYWLAGFPLEGWYDPSRTLSSRRDEILASWRAYVSRFRGEGRLLGYVFGDLVQENYGAKFAGPAADFDDLLAAAANILAEVEPFDAPLLATSTRDVRQLREAPAGLSFWLWNAGPRRDLTVALDEISRSSGRPVLVEGYTPDGIAEEEPQAQVVASLAQSILDRAGLLGGLYGAHFEDNHSPRGVGLFRLSASERSGLDHAIPQAAYRALSGIWGGRTPPAWKLTSVPRMEELVHAATGTAGLAPGTLARITGKELEQTLFTANGIPWPLHLGETCLCVGDRPVPLGMIGAESGTALIPWDLSEGDHPVLLYRAGRATNLAAAKVRAYAPGLFPGALVRAGTFCRVTEQNGVRPGELLEAYSTGLGPGAPSWMTPTVSVGHTPAEVLYSGTLPNFVGLNQINLRIHPATAPGTNIPLEIRSGDFASPPYRLSVAAPEERFGVLLTAGGADVTVQAGGAGVITGIGAEGRSGYCGPVLLSSGGQDGITFRAPVGFTGEVIPVEVRADSSAAPREQAPLVFHGYAPGAVSGQITVKVTVLAGRGDVRVRVISGGFRAQPLARFDWNGRTLFAATGGGAGRGISVLSVEAATGVFSSVRSFDTWGDEMASERLLEYLNSLPPGTVVMFAVADDGSFLLSPQTRTAIARMFGSGSIQGLAYQQSWAMISRKGAASPIAESLSSESQVMLEQVITFPQP